MKLKIDPVILSQQISMCDSYAYNASKEHDRNMLYGIGNILSEIAWAIENGEDVKFAIANDEEV